MRSGLKKRRIEFSEPSRMARPFSSLLPPPALPTVPPNRFYLKKKAFLSDGSPVGDCVRVYVGSEGDLSLDNREVPNPARTIELLVEVDSYGRFVRPPISDLKIEDVLGALLE